MKVSNLLATTLLLISATSASAHFQMIYTPESSLGGNKNIPIRLIFTHPFEAVHSMEMGKPEAFFVVHDEKKQDLLETLTPIKWHSLENSASAWSTDVKLRSMGDYVFGVIPAPYYEKSEDLWMQQCTKIIVNIAGIPSDWDSNIGLPAEIEPLAKPYALWTGNAFAGVVTADGKPVPFAEVEVEYLNHDIDLELNSFKPQAKITNANDAIATQTIKADANGTFVYAPPKAGWWGFAALDVAVRKEKDKEIHQDAVIWVQVRDAK